VPLLFRQSPRFQGLPASGFAVFGLADRDERRQAIVSTFHPPLKLLGEDLLEELEPDEPGAAPRAKPLHPHLPRLDWPRGYQPFCTWLALSREAHGYQAGPQLNVGVHADHVAVRLGWDTGSDRFGRFEFLCRRGDLGPELSRIAIEQDLAFRVYSAAEWPEGSRLVFDSQDGLVPSFQEVARRGVWWEIGTRYEVPRALPLIDSADLFGETARIFRALLPIYDRIAG
jgi:hypothetical protein